MNTKEAVSIVKGESWVLCREKYVEAMEYLSSNSYKLEKSKENNWFKNKDTNALINEIRKVLENK